MLDGDGPVSCADVQCGEGCRAMPIVDEPLQNAWRRPLAGRGVKNRKFFPQPPWTDSRRSGPQGGVSTFGVLCTTIALGQPNQAFHGSAKLCLR
jgi:hypothetical protein